MLKDALVALCFDDVRKLGYTNGMSSWEFVSLLRQEYGFSDVEAFSLAFRLKHPMLWSDDLIRIDLDLIRFFAKATQEEMLEESLQQWALYDIPDKYKAEKKTSYVPSKVILNTLASPFTVIEVEESCPYKRPILKLGVSFNESSSK